MVLIFNHQTNICAYFTKRDLQLTFINGEKIWKLNVLLYFLKSQPNIRSLNSNLVKSKTIAYSDGVHEYVPLTANQQNLIDLHAVLNTAGVADDKIISVRPEIFDIESTPNYQCTIQGHPSILYLYYFIPSVTQGYKIRVNVLYKS